MRNDPKNQFAEAVNAAIKSLYNVLEYATPETYVRCANAVGHAVESLNLLCIRSYSPEYQSIGHSFAPETEQ